MQLSPGQQAVLKFFPHLVHLGPTGLMEPQMAINDLIKDYRQQPTSGKKAAIARMIVDICFFRGESPESVQAALKGAMRKMEGVDPL